MPQPRQFNPIDTATFIDAWEKEESLWNSVLESYKDRNQRQAATDRLCNEFGCCGKAVRRKINSLRSYFLAEVRKECVRRQSSGNGAVDEIFESKWPFFNRMSFLHDAITSRKTFLASNNAECESDSLDDDHHVKEVKAEMTSTSPSAKKSSTSDLSQNNSDCESDSLDTSRVDKEAVRLSNTHTSSPAYNKPTRKRTKTTRYKESQSYDDDILESSLLQNKTDKAGNDVSVNITRLPKESLPLAQSTTRSKRQTTTTTNHHQEPDTVESDSEQSEISPGKKQKRNGEPIAIFGKHVVQEISSLKTNYARQWAKLKIQEVLFQANFITDCSQQETNVVIQHQPPTMVPSAHNTTTLPGSAEYA